MQLLDHLQRERVALQRLRVGLHVNGVVQRVGRIAEHRHIGIQSQRVRILLVDLKYGYGLVLGRHQQRGRERK